MRSNVNNQLQKYHSNKKSKLAYYISIELELFPGTSANALQKTAMRCQSNFERIRESWADLWGYQYRPGALTEAYNYEHQMNVKREDVKREDKIRKDKISKYNNRYKSKNIEDNADLYQQNVSAKKYGGKNYKNKTCKNRYR
jgi:hypothetical protein